VGIYTTENVGGLVTTKRQESSHSSSHILLQC